MGFNKRKLWKRKIRWYTIPMKVQSLSSFEKQKEYVLAHVCQRVPNFLFKSVKFTNGI